MAGAAMQPACRYQCGRLWGNITISPKRLTVLPRSCYNEF